MNNLRSTKISVGMSYQIQSSSQLYIYTWIFENGITNFTPRPGWQRVHLRLAVYFLGGGDCQG